VKEKKNGISGKESVIVSENIKIEIQIEIIETVVAVVVAVEIVQIPRMILFLWSKGRNKLYEEKD